MHGQQKWSRREKINTNERNYSLNDAKRDLNGSIRISHFAYLHSTSNDFDLWIIVPFEINFLLLKVELPEEKFQGLFRVLKFMFFFPLLDLQKAHTGQETMRSTQHKARHAVMHLQELSCQAASPRVCSMQPWEKRSSRQDRRTRFLTSFSLSDLLGSFLAFLFWFFLSFSSLISFTGTTFSLTISEVCAVWILIDQSEIALGSQ